MITTDTTSQPYSKPYPPAMVKAMEAIIAMPSGPKRWRAVAATWVNINQLQADGYRAKEAYLKAVEAVEKKRAELLDPKFGLIGDHGKADTNAGMRESLELPAGLWSWLKLFDMDAFRTPADIKRNMKALRQEFPEFTVAEKH
jgi:hypothetical protein